MAAHLAWSHVTLGVVGWQPPRPDEDTDVAETKGLGPRTIPPWVKSVIAILIVGGLVFLLVRFLAQAPQPAQIKYTLGKTAFPDRFRVAVELTMLNESDNEQDVSLDTSAVPGLRMVGIGSGLEPTTQDVVVTIPASGSAKLNAVWQVTDCSIAAADPERRPVIVATTGLYAGTRKDQRLRLDPVRKLLPEVCDSNGEEGRPGVVDFTVRKSGNSRSIEILVENTGGRVLMYKHAILHPKSAPGVLFSAPTTGDGIPVGESRTVTVTFALTPDGCRPASNLPARLALNFTTPATGKGQDLDVDLGGTWSKVLGPCPTD